MNELYIKNNEKNDSTENITGSDADIGIHKLNKRIVQIIASGIEIMEIILENSFGVIFIIINF